MSRVTLSRYLIEQTRSNNTPADLRFLIEVVARACKEISHAVSKGALGGVLGSADSENIQGEVQKKLDVLADEGYIRGYAVAAARPGWLDDPENQDKLARFLRATLKGAQDAAADLPTVQKIMKERFGLSEEATESQWEINDRVITLDDKFYADYCSLAAWMKTKDMLTASLDFEDFADGRAIAEVDPSRFAQPPASCD